MRQILSRREPSISFQELYERRSENSTIEASNKGSRSAFGDIRESLRLLRMNNPTNSNNNTTIETNVRRSENSAIQASNKGSRAGPSFEAIRESLHQLKINKSNSSTIQASNKGSGGGPSFNAICESLHQLKINQSNSNNNHQINNNRGYSYEVLGKKLRMLRPPEGKRGGDWFSLGELNERLMKLKKVEE
ncbi:hypothetical protein RHMOL_Rhmol08G0279600 [Rhododendron molle]|uniref:Uncharacterized protein n=1 Tax=Rhododendron molle TaxID=49168 RepID=A0ACC0MV96_RHOML|nr:hypothetical protein RHMOL_Rhmol08G0279600 [Rhododendron molle]